MSRQPTPGPWKIARPRKKRGITLSEALFIEAENPLPGHGETVCGLGAGIVHFANSEANGRLIAAAPELLKALQEIAKNPNPSGRGFGHWAQLMVAIPAIEKATGGAS